MDKNKKKQFMLFTPETMHVREHVREDGTKEPSRTIYGRAIVFNKLYEGLGVPMVTSWKNDRRLYIGWLNHVHGWGGWLVFREVVSYPDGHLGLKWVPEITPPVPPCTYKVAKGARFERRFRPQGTGPALLLTVDPPACS